MAKEKSSFSMTLEIGPKGMYLTVLDAKGGMSEYLILPPALTFLVPILNTVMQTAVLLSGDRMEIKGDS